MASLKFSSSIEHVCLHEWNLSTLWLDAGFNTWTLTDTILFAMFALLCVCYQTTTSSSPKMDFVLPYLLPFFPFFSPLICIPLHCTFFSTPFLVSLSLLSWNHPCSSLKRLFSLQAQWNITKLFPTSCACTRKRCIRNISANPRAWGTTWGFSNKSSLQGL